MLHRVLRARRWLIVGLVGLLALVVAGASPAQSLNDGMDALNKKLYDNRDLIKKLFIEGQPLNANADADKEAVDLAAKAITYP